MLSKRERERFDKLIDEGYGQNDEYAEEVALAGIDLAIAVLSQDEYVFTEEAYNLLYFYTEWENIPLPKRVVRRLREKCGEHADETETTDTPTKESEGTSTTEESLERGY